MTHILKYNIPCNAFNNIEKSSSSVQLVLDIIKPGLLQDSFISFLIHSVNIVEFSFSPLNVSYFLLNFNKNSCFSFNDIG